jgi:hypothetical protein
MLPEKQDVVDLELINVSLVPLVAGTASGGAIIGLAQCQMI